MDEWVHENFSEYAPGEIVISLEPYMITCDREWLIKKLNGLSVPPNYEVLSNLPLAEEGWQKVFDYWKSVGIVS